MTWFKRLLNWTSEELMKLSLILIVIATSWALFRPGFFRVHDYTHATRISEMARALADGHFPVRWSSNLGYGYGMPLFNFYAPLPYYIGAIFFSLGLDVVLCIKLLYLICTILTAWGAFQLGRDWFGRWGGVLSAAALTLAPYRAVNLFVRGAVSEAWAIAFLPIIIWAMGRVIKHQKSAWGWLVFGLVGLFLSHNITTMLFLPICFGSGLVLIIIHFWHDWAKFSWAKLFKIIGSLVSAGLVSLSLAGFYLIPAFLEKDLTQYKDTILSGYFDYNLHFLYIRQFLNPVWMYGGSGWGPYDGISFFLGAGQILAVVGLGLGLIFKLLKKGSKGQNYVSNQQFSLVGVAAGITGTALYLSLLKSAWIWQRFSLLAMAQFPWRWLSVGVVGLAILVAALAAVLPKAWWRGLVLSLIWLTIVIGNLTNFRPEAFLTNPSGFYYTDPKKIQTAMSSVLPDYIPRQMWLMKPPENLWLNSELNFKDVEILVNRTQEKLVKVRLTQPTQFDWSVADFPSWQVEVDGWVATKTQGEIGNVGVSVPAGEHLVGLIWAGSQIEQLSNWLSLTSALGLLGWLIFRIQSTKTPKVRS